MYESQVNRVSKLIHDLHEKVENLEKENVKLKSDMSDIYDNHKSNMELENDQHNVGHLDEKMKRLDYLEKIFSENRYVFSDIPNTPENMKMVKLMKKHINKRKYTMRWRGQYLNDGEDWRKYQICLL